MKTCDDFLKEVEERAARATKGPWTAERDHVVVSESFFDSDPGTIAAFGHSVKYRVIDSHCIDEYTQDNCLFIAASRTDVEMLARMVRAAKIKHCTCCWAVDGWLLRACSMCEELDRLANRLHQPPLSCGGTE